MVVLSLFDGMAGAMVALRRAGLDVSTYFSSETDRYAIKIALKNYPEIIQLRNISNIDGYSLPKIDLLIGGSPCQGFTFAGKQLNFDDPRSKLFFEFARLLRETKPTWFLLENVRMKQQYQDVISGYLGVKPVLINSDRFVCQNRQRLYWTNIPINSLPDRPDWNNRYYQYRRWYLRENKSGVCPALTGNMGTGGHNVPLKKIFEDEVERYYKSKTAKSYYDKVRKQYIFEGERYKKLIPVECERLQTFPDNYSEGVSNTQRYKMLGNAFTVDVIAHILRGIYVK